MKKERMNKRLFALALAIVTTAAMSITSFAAGPAAPKEKLPEFRFTNEAPYMNAILDYMTDSERNGYEAGDVMIPNFVILKEDLSDPQDIKVWGNFWIMNYDLEGDNLMHKNGGEAPGLMHLKKTAGGYVVTGADMVGDGSDNGPDSERIFGVDDDLMRAYRNQDIFSEMNRTNTIRHYVFGNDLPVSTFQDYGWDKVLLR